MIRYRLHPHRPRLYVCDACHRLIDEPAQVRLLRAQAALPEEETYIVHARCVDRFIRERDETWQVYTLDDAIAAWVL